MEKGIIVTLCLKKGKVSVLISTNSSLKVWYYIWSSCEKRTLKTSPASKWDNLDISTKPVEVSNIKIKKGYESVSWPETLKLSLVYLLAAIILLNLIELIGNALSRRQAL